MKKFAVLFAVVVLIAFAAPVFAATNPFMDVPMNSWAYDAVAQLASKGILSGYPDGLYKGRQPMTRYEAASAIARALAYVDMTKASKQDVDMLKRLVIEFKDELDALGVRVDAIEKDVNRLRGRLGGWRMSGRLRFDVDYRSSKDGAFDESIGDMGTHDARINIDRFFGPNEEAYFRMQVRSRNAVWDYAAREFMAEYFFVKIPFAFGSYLTVGRTGDDDIDQRFGFGPDMGGRYGNFGWFNDARRAVMILEKSFETASFYGALSHPGTGAIGDGWEFLFNVNFNWNEQFKFGIGAHVALQDDWRETGGGVPYSDVWSNAFTGWLGIDFKFTEGAALHGIVYFQSKSGDDPVWDDNGNAWRVALDLNQDLLKFTSFWAEYGRVGEGFWAPMGLANNVFVIGDRDAGGPGLMDVSIAPTNISFWKLGAVQKWTPEVRTWLFYVNATGELGGVDFGMRQYGIGIDYLYNPYTIFSLNYMKWDGLDAFDDYEYSRIRFTTQVSF